MIRELSSIYETKFQGRWQREAPSGRVDAHWMKLVKASVQLVMRVSQLCNRCYKKKMRYVITLFTSTNIE